MRVAVASEDGRSIAAHTGRCRAFAIYDVAAGGARLVEQRLSGHKPSGESGCHTQHSAGERAHDHSALVDTLADCQVLITCGLGPRLVTDLASRGVEAYVCAVAGVEEAIRLFSEGRLPRLAGSGCGRHA